MSTSLFLAKLIGPVFLVVGIGLLFNVESFRSLLTEFIKNPVLVYLAGVLGLVGGLALVLNHNFWIADWRLIITLVGWIALIRGVVTILRPQWIVSIGNRISQHKAIFLAAGIVDFIIGAALSYFGYIA